MSRGRRFEPGAVVATPGALAVLARHGEEPGEYLARHLSGDWGDLCEFDRRENARALESGARLFSSYDLGDGRKLWVITEADRSSTCLLLPEEY